MNKSGILQSCIRVNTIVQLHHLKSNKTMGEKVTNTKMVRVNKSQKQQLYGLLPPIPQTIQ